MDHRRLRQLAAGQRGLFSRRQARELGYSASQIRRRLSNEQWQVVLGPVLAWAELRITQVVRDRAAPLAIQGGVVAGPSAARAWGIADLDARTFLAVRPDHHPSLREVVFLRGAIDRRDITRWEGAAITTVRRTVADCLRILPDQQSLDLLDRALQRRWITLAELIGYHQQWIGRKGSAKIRKLIGAVAQGSRSKAERIARELLTDAGIHGWVANAPIDDIGDGDIVFKAERLVLEIDGIAYHSSNERFQYDRVRQNRLMAAGWTVLRFTWLDITERPDYVVSTVSAMLAQLRQR